MEKQREQPRRSLDRFMQWCNQTVNLNRKNKGDYHGNEKKEIKEAANLLRTGHSELGGLPNLAGQV